MGCCRRGAVLVEEALLKRDGLPGGGCRGRSTALRVSVSPFPDMANHVAGPIDAPGGASGFS